MNNVNRFLMRHMKSMPARPNDLNIIKPNKN